MTVLDYKNSCTWFLHHIKSNKFLLQLRDENYKPFPNFWTFPGGVIETKEHPKEAALRELKEEYNYTPAHIEEVLTIYHHSKKIAEHHYYIPLEVELDELENNEGKRSQLFSIEEIKGLKLGWWGKEVIPILERHVSEL